MKQIINCKQILGATFLLLGMAVGQANAEYFLYNTKSNYSQAGLDDVALKKSQGLECSYYGDGQPELNDANFGYGAQNNKGYGGVAYIFVMYNGIDLCGGNEQYYCDRTIRTTNIMQPTGRGFGSIYWDSQYIATFAQGVYYDSKGNPTGVYDAATNSVAIEGYRYYPYGKASGRFGSYLREVCRGPIDISPVFVERKTESKTLTCPSAQPNGTWIQERSYDLYTDSSQKNATEWTDKTKTCTAAIVDSGTSTRTVNCPAPQTGLISQGKSYQKWSDGRIEFLSGWSVQSNTCALPKFDVNENERKELCPEGYTGFKSYKWVLKYKNVEYTALDEGGVEIKYTLSTPYEEEVLNVDTCKIIDSIPEITSRPGSESITCDAYYGSAKGTYVGDVVSTGNYVTAYSSATKQTTTVFNATSVDASSCKQDSDKSINGETRKVDCPVDQNGQITEVRYVATDSKGNVTYPYGSEFTVLENNCSNPSLVDNVIPPQIYDTSTLIQNLYLSSTMLSDAESADEIVSALSQKVVKKNEMHKLNLEINDLTPANFNRESVSRAIKTFSRVAGNTSKVHISLPTDIQMYVGNGELLDTSNKSFSSVRLNSNNDVEMSYFEIDKKSRMSSPKKKTIVFSIFNEEISKLNME